MMFPGRQVADTLVLVILSGEASKQGHSYTLILGGIFLILVG